MKKLFYLGTFILFLFPFFSLELKASEDDVYTFSWLDPDKEVYVLQNRKFRKKGSLHLSGSYGFTTSGAFVNSTHFQGRGGFYFREEWGFEALYTLSNGEENTAAKAVRGNGVGPGTVPFRRIIDSYAGAMIMWSPFYSKMNTFNTIIYMDWVFGLGGAQINVKSNRAAFIAQADDQEDALATPDDDESHMGLMWGASLQVYASAKFHVRLDLTVLHYQALGVAEDVNNEILRSNFDLSIGLGYRF